MAMRLVDLVKEVEAAAAQAKFGRINHTEDGFVCFAGFQVTAHLDGEGNLLGGSTYGSSAATVQFDVMKLIESVDSDS